MTEYYTFGNIEVPVMEWTNYGDVNPIEHGGLWVKPDVPTFPNCFYIVEVTPMEDKEGWFVSDGYVDLNDSWIDWQAVYSYTDTSWTDEPIIRALSAFQYYGPKEFQGEIQGERIREDVLEYLKEWEIEV